MGQDVKELRRIILMHYKAPTESALFLLRDVLKFDNDLSEPIINEAAKLCEEVIFPTNADGDNGCELGVFEHVNVPYSFHKAYEEFSKGGWGSLSIPEEFGGQGLPNVLFSSINEFVCSGNMAFSLFPGITKGAITAILEAGTPEQKRYFIPRMASGEWTGTMNLTEPHCGTDLGMLKTKAVSNGKDTEFYITGQKIFISCGEHDLTENIIHLVLARVEGDPEGTKGISLFIVPKMLGDKPNDLSVGSIEHKMGIKGSPACVMNYDGAVGFLLGERCKGLNVMFHMMNEERINCAIQALGQSELAYQNALEYARERIQSSRITDPKGPAVAIINHPDVRRMLLDIRSFNEAARLCIYEAALLVDDLSDDAQERLGLITPVLKGMFTDYGFENAVKAQQVFGGHGYIKEWGMEQIVRDVRITQIYEGANGIQAMDLVGRKLPKNMGRGIIKFLEDSKKTIEPFENHKFSLSTDSALSDLKRATKWLMNNAMRNPNNAGSAAYSYMKMFGLVLLALAHVRICDATDDTDRHNTARYFMEYILPETKLLLQRIEAGSDSMMNAGL
jgi:alkylation response protein AidB-like acyl-CoA dehydrogenase